MERKAEISRTTRETNISLSLNLDGTGKRDISTGIGFFDHMLTAFAMHGSFDLAIKATGDLDVDAHHTVEDIGIVLGQAFFSAIADKNGIARYGFFILPMDEALCRTALDISSRPFLVFKDNGLTSRYMPGFDAALIPEFLRAFAFNAGITLHCEVLNGENPHHIIECIFKSLARALRSAVAISGDALPSTKGLL